MANDINLAAHIDHSIEHSFADIGNFIGLAVGIVAAVAITVYSGGSAILWAGAAIGLGGWIGEKIGGFFTDEDSGHIARGSPNVFYGPRVMAAARMNDRTACESPGMAIMETISPFLGAISPVGAAMGLISLARTFSRMNTVENMQLQGLEVLASDVQAGAHAGSKIADGSISVLVNQWPAARKGDGVFPCNGKISGGIESIVIGGPQGSLRGTDRRSEINQGQKDLQDVLGLITDPVGSGIALVSLGADRLDIPILKQVADWAGLAWSVRSLIRGKPQGLERALSLASLGTGTFNAGSDAIGLAGGPPNGFTFDERTMTSSPRP